MTGGRVNAYAAVDLAGSGDFDSDNDGMGDFWEEDNFSGIDAKDGTDDSDHDGYSDLQEFINYTDPNEQDDPGGTGYDPATDDLTISGSVSSDNDEVFVSLIIDGEIIDVQTANQGDFRFELSSDPAPEEYILTAADNDTYGEIIVAGTFLPIVDADIDLTPGVPDLVHLTFDSDIDYEKTVYTERSDLIFQITAEDGTGPVTEFSNGLILTLPFSLEQVTSGEFESGDVTIYHAGTRAELLAGDGAAIPVDDIIAVDYIGDGQTGQVTFRVYSLSVFGIGSGVKNSGGGGGGGCFISGMAKIPGMALPAAMLVLAVFIPVFNRIMRSRPNR